MDIITSKGIITEEINKIIKSYSDNETLLSEKAHTIQQELSQVNQYNQRLISEVSEKDKLLHLGDLKMEDYEVMINKIQEDANKELTEKERFDMLKKQDTEIHERDIEIKRLQKKINGLEEKLSLIDKENIELVIREDDSQWMKLEKNTYINDKEKVAIALEMYSNHINKDVSLEELGKTSIGINGWYEQKDAIDSDETDSMDDDNKNDDETEIETKVIDNDDNNNDDNKNDDNKNDDETEIETKVIDDNKNDDETEIETKVIDIDDNNDDGSSSEDNATEVEIITHYKKEYYTIINETPQYIYAIEDGELGNKVGIIDEKGKKKFYKSSKK